MAAAGSVRAGRAYVEVGVDDTDLRKGLSAARNRMDSFASGMATVGTQLAAAGVAALTPLALATVQFADFEQGMARVRALSNATQAEFEALSAKARQLGAETVFSATQAAEAMGFFALAGFSVDETLKAIGPTLDLAAAGQLEVGQAADISAKIMRGFGIAAADVGFALDVLTKAMTTANTDLPQLGEAMKFVGPLAKGLKIPFTEATAAVQLLSNAGIQGEMAGTTLRGALLSLIGPSSEAAKEMTRLGINVQDAAGNFVGLPSVLDQFNAKLAGLGDVARTDILGRIFNARQVTGVIELLNQGGDTLRAYTGELEDAGGAAKRVADVQLDTLKSQAVIVKSALVELGIAAGVALAGPLRNLTATIIQLTQALAEFAKRNEWAVKLLAAFGIGLVTVGGLLLTAALALKAYALALGGLQAVLVVTRGIQALAVALGAQSFAAAGAAVSVGALVAAYALLAIVAVAAGVAVYQAVNAAIAARKAYQAAAQAAQEFAAAEQEYLDKRGDGARKLEAQLRKASAVELKQQISNFSEAELVAFRKELISTIDVYERWKRAAQEAGDQGEAERLQRSIDRLRQVQGFTPKPNVPPTPETKDAATAKPIDPFADYLASSDFLDAKLKAAIDTERSLLEFRNAERERLIREGSLDAITAEKQRAAEEVALLEQEGEMLAKAASRAQEKYNEAFRAGDVEGFKKAAEEQISIGQDQAVNNAKIETVKAQSETRVLDLREQKARAAADLELSLAQAVGDERLVKELEAASKIASLRKALGSNITTEQEEKLAKLQAELQKGITAANQKASGTFSAAAAGRLATDSTTRPMKNIEGHTKETADQTKRIADKLATGTSLVWA